MLGSVIITLNTPNNQNLLVSLFSSPRHALCSKQTSILTKLRYSTHQEMLIKEMGTQIRENHLVVKCGEGVGDASAFSQMTL